MYIWVKIQIWIPNPAIADASRPYLWWRIRRSMAKRLVPPIIRDKTSPGIRKEENGVVESHSWGMPMPLVRINSMPPITAVIPRKKSTRINNFLTWILYQRHKKPSGIIWWTEACLRGCLLYRGLLRIFQLQGCLPENPILLRRNFLQPQLPH